MFVAGQDVRLAEPAAIERGDDPRRDVVDVDRRDPEVGRAPMYGSVPVVGLP